MRSIPGMVVCCPCDANEMTAAVKALLEYEGPAYLRLGRLAVETVTDGIPGYQFELGKGITVRQGKDVTIIAVGMMVQKALTATEFLAEEGIDARVIDMHTIKPLDVELVEKAARETGCIVTTEEHNIIGGLGEAVAACVAERCPVPVVRHGVEDTFGRSGKAELVLEKYGLTPEGIAALPELLSDICPEGRGSEGPGCWIGPGGRPHPKGLCSKPFPPPPSSGRTGRKRNPRW